MNDFIGNEDLGKLILRLTLGLLMLFHGVAKIQSPETVEYIGTSLAGFGLPAFLAYGVYLGEIVAPALLVLGMFSRYSAMVIIVNMLFAIFLMHGGDLLSLSQHGGWRIELQGFYLFSALAIVFLGSGQRALIPD